MKLHSNLAVVIVTGVILTVMIGVANDPTIHDAWLQSQGPRGERPAVTLSERADAVDRWFQRASDRLWSLPVLRDIDPNPPPALIYSGETVGYGPGSADSIPAFPNCEGPGCGALQQYRPNGVRVCRVTNLASSGAGSFQACIVIVEADSNSVDKPLDVVVFDTAGAIHWSPTCAGSDCSLWRGLYVAGQSAPGPVVLYDWGLAIRGGSEDVVLRGIAHRGRQSCGSTSWRMRGYRMISDHISVSHGCQRMVQSYAQGPDYGPFDDSTYNSRYHTWSRNFLSYKGSQSNRTTNVSDPPTMLMFNSQPRPAALLSHVAWLNGVIFAGAASYRTPNINGDTAWVHGSLWYMHAAGNQWSVTNDGGIADFTYNEYRGGGGVSSNPANSDYWPLAQDSVNDCEWISSDTLPALCADATFHYNKNHVSHIHEAQAFYAGTYGDTIASQDTIWNNGTGQAPGSRYIGQYPGLGSFTDSTTPPIARRRTTGLPYSLPFGFDTVTVDKANMDLVLDSAGSGWRIDSLGAPYMVRDTVDRRARAAITDSVSYLRPGDTNTDSFLVDFFPDFEADVSPKCRDEDFGGSGDGMCDAWEELVADTSLLPTTIQASGYSTIELAYAGGIINIDTVIGESGEPPAPPPGVPSDLAFRQAEGYGRNTLETCRDSVVNGSWDLKVWIVDPATYRTGYSDADGGFTAIVHDSTSSDQFDIVILPEGGFVNVFNTADDLDRYKLLLEKSCVYITGAAAQGEGPPALVTPYDTRSVQVIIASDSVNVHDILFRNIKVFADSFIAPYSNTGNILKVFGGSRLYFDHTSWHLGRDGIEFYGATDTLEDITWGASMSGGVGADGSPEFTSTNFIGDFFDDDPTPGEDKPFTSMSVLRSAFVSSSYRMPLFSSEISKDNPDSMLIHGPIEWINIMAYDAYSNRMSALYGDDEMDVISSWWGEGTSTVHSNGEIQVRGCYSPQIESCGSTYPWFATPGIYASDLGYYEAKVLKYNDYYLFKYLGGPTDPEKTTPLPDSIKNVSRTGTSNVTEIWGHAGVPDSLFTAGNIRRQVGAVLTLTCGGTYQLKRDSTDQWFYQRYLDDAVGSQTNTTRGWGVQVYRDSLIGTSACSDADSDGLPDVFETSIIGNTTDVPPDTLIAGFLAIEHYLNGDSLYVQTYESEEVTDETYNTTPARFVHIDSARWDTAFSNLDPVTGEPQNTLVYYWPSLDSVPVGTPWAPLLLDDSLHVLITTVDTLSPPFSVRDSAWVDSVLNANTDLCNDRGACAPAYPRTMTLPGAP